MEAGLIDPGTYKRVVRMLTSLGSINFKDMSGAEAREGDALVGLTFRLAALAKSSITNSNGKHEPKRCDLSLEKSKSLHQKSK